MAAKKAATKKATRKRTRKVVEPAPKPEVVVTPFRVLLFTDLHVRADTLDRAIAVLDFVNQKATELEVDDVVFLGDFWDQRGVLSVRQVDRVMDAFDKWTHKLRLIPGNHDQVTVDGTVHGLRIFEKYPNIEVIHEPCGTEDKLFLPWREGSEEQNAMFESPSCEGRTIFAHAEATGASANNGHVMDGRFSLADASKARAVYLGHFHKRQQIGDNVFYIGSPFEQNFGERDMPHGIALVTSEKIEPEWFEVPGMPKHHRISYPDGLDDFLKVVPGDIVEVHAPSDETSAPTFLKALTRPISGASWV